MQLKSLVSRHDKEFILGQKALSIFIFGSNNDPLFRSVVARDLEYKLQYQSYMTVLFESDLNPHK